MKRLIVTTISILMFVGGVFAQQYATSHEHFYTDDLFLNPAYVGTPKYAPIQATVMQKYAGLGAASPTTALLSFHTRVGQGYFRSPGGLINKYPTLGNIAVGGYLVSYNYGANHINNLNVVYGYHLPLHYKYDRSIILALTTGYRNVLFNLNELSFRNPSDPIFGAAWASANIFNSDVAALYKGTRFEAGMGVKNWIQTENRLESDTLYESSKMNLFANARYTFGSKKYWIDFIPTAFALLDYNKKLEVIGNMEVKMDDVLAIGGNIRHRAIYEEAYASEMTVYASVSYNKFKYQYAYSTNFSKLSTYSYGSHHITVGYCFGKKYTRGPRNQFRKPILFKQVIDNYDVYKNYSPGSK